MTCSVFIVLGMAGCGKSTFCHRMYSWLSEKNIRMNKETGLNDAVYGINLDPASISTKMPLHYDIQEDISIEELMQKKELGPNGAILTALNLFITKIDQLISKIEETNPNYVVIDTPGQIEMFTLSVSGHILTKCLSSPKRKVSLLYVVDGEKAQNPQCFISNMLFASSIYFSFKVPLLLLVNKSDLPGAEKVREWMQDMDALTKDLSEEAYITATIRSIALWTEEFYSTIPLAYVSSSNGTGKYDLLEKLSKMHSKR
ncbi:GPN-loop GTPase [Nematocida sp. LUAm3]|nr:GPN-loop GTPase [Nematocida sp. LUAm3]KAI5174491.1 GPN-loop GTPase [Nematocida sp. LUAm2]KAI5179142.1 GPN-loop GTPase [Nematocida sp. LUAm1]